ncbi:MAG: hypothetical protein AMS25_10565 [Gemmatimonas sp. SM23_52]|nr:MAG: hypothetical protein AMS25_10565 [Gemmatimonas sp. SM23_52]
MALALSVAAVVLVSVAAVLLGQYRYYAAHAQRAATRDAARIAAEVLGAELRALSPAAGDLYAISPDSVALRSSTGLGVVCTVNGNHIGLRWVTGSFADSDADSVLIFRDGDPGTALDDSWAALGSRWVGSGGAGRCPDGRSAELELAVDGSLAGVAVGAPVRGFRAYVYKLYLGRDGRWWLGQRLRHGRVQPIVGPFAPPDSGGLRLEYLSRIGIPTRDPREVVQVRVSVKAQSVSPLPGPSGAEWLDESLSVSVYLRNSAAGHIGSDHEPGAAR